MRLFRQPGSGENVDGTAEVELNPDEAVEVVAAAENGLLVSTL